MNRIIPVILLLIFFNGNAQTLSVEQLQSDFDLFKRALDEVHPEKYRYTSKIKYDSLLTQTNAKLNKPMSQQEFYILMNPLLVALKDGHIKWIVSGKDEHYPFNQDKLFPLKLYFLEKKAWVIDNYGKEEIQRGIEIKSINGESVSSIIETLLPRITFADGFTINGKYEDLNDYFAGYYATYYGGFDSFKVSFIIGGEEKTLELKAITENEIKDYQNRNNPVVKSPYSLTFLNNTAIIKIDRFWNYKEEEHFDTFLKNTFKVIKEKRTENIVLDLRNNEGGEEKYGVWLYSYLANDKFDYYDHISVSSKRKFSFPAWKPKFYSFLHFLLTKKTDNGHVLKRHPGLKKRIKPDRNAFNGKVYTLMNGKSFSTTTEFLARMHADKRGIFIGQETGGGYSGDNSGVFTILQLPNSKIDLGIPMFGFYMANLPSDMVKGQGIKPDYEVIPTAKNIIEKQDVVMEYALDIIDNKVVLIK